MKANWKSKKPVKCGVYCVADLIDALPNGGNVLGGIGAESNQYIATASNFCGAGVFTAVRWGQFLQNHSGIGKTPVQSIVVIGHGIGTENRIGGDKSGVPFSFDAISFDPRPKNFAWPNFENAVSVNLPQGCWLQTDATVRLVGCNTRRMAEIGKRPLGRGPEQRFFGTKTYTFAPAGGMGWGKISGSNIVHDTSKPTATATNTNTYHFGAGHIDNWEEY